MYDALNRGLRRASGEICAHLNCDEQYLPGALAAVAEYFAAHPDVDIVLGDVVVVDEACNYLCSRNVIRPRYVETLVVSLGTFTAATFIRRSALERYDLYFSRDWQFVADAVWMLKALKAGAKIGLLGRVTSTFMDDGGNLALSGQCHAEGLRLTRTAPRWIHRLRLLWVLSYRLRRLLGGCYHPRPIEYQIYTPENPAQRTSFQIAAPQWRWASRLALASPHRDARAANPSA
jgi:glycosyltransferase involved in cell wall biosynthesis